MFTKARSSDMDLDALGEQLQQRKQQVMSEEQGSRAAGSSRGRGKPRVPAGMLSRRNGRGQQEGARGRH
jgi:hypothetical protein